MNNLRRALLVVATAMLVHGAYAQGSRRIEQIKKELSLCPEKTGGIYYAYHAPDSGAGQAAVPRGYTPFYVSHYGRHGSRHLTADSRYMFLLGVFDSLHAQAWLTPLGEDVRLRLHRVWREAEGRGGSLTAVGERQHRGIAERMAARCPQIFRSGAVSLSAVSSTVPRCIMSMAAFCERLKEINSALVIRREASQRTMDYVAWTSPAAKALEADTAAWKAAWSADRESSIRPSRLVASLTTRSMPADSARYFMEEMYALASDMQDIEMTNKPSFYDLFTAEELYVLWRSANWRMYVCNANAPAGRGAGPRSAARLLSDIIQRADSAIASGGVTADLRFGHDTSLIRLLALMKAGQSGTSQTDPALFPAAWQGYNVSPMAANLQITFYRDEKGGVAVRLMLNEKDVQLPLKSLTGPFYKWSDVRRLWRNAVSGEQYMP